jgi:Icc-related predicted phosphoesterase
MMRKIIFGLLWLGFISYAFFFAPPEQPDTFELIKNLEKKIMVSHIHAAGTKSELSGVAGSDALRAAIEKFQPDIFLSGHIHEAEGIEEKIGKTKVINVGKRGKIIEI